jgi:hypothetical protein
MARKPNMFRRVAVATALADGISAKKIARKYAEEWHLTRGAIHAMIKTLLKSWASQEAREHSSISPWKKTQTTIERMDQLRSVLSTGEARGSIVRRYAELWALQPAYVDELITRVLDEDQHELIAQSEAQRLRYVARIRSYLSRYANAHNFPDTIAAYERLITVSKGKAA